MIEDLAFFGSTLPSLRVSIRYQTSFNEVIFLPYVFSPCFTALFCSGMTAVGLTSLPSPSCAEDVIQVASIYRLRLTSFWPVARPVRSHPVWWVNRKRYLNCLCRDVPEWSSCVKYAWYCSSWFMKVRLCQMLQE